MASIGNDPNGHKRILFVAGDGRRKTIRLGKVSKKLAEQIKRRVEVLNAAAIAGDAPEEETSRWLQRVEQGLLDKLAAAGLIEHRKQYRLGEFLDEYYRKRSDVKPSTKLVYGHTRRCLIEYFGGDKPIREITAADADDWARWLAMDEEGKPKSPRLAENTVRRRCGLAKQFFRYATRKRLIETNPFQDLGAVVGGNDKRMYFVTRAEAEKVLAACPDAQWRLLFALSRFGGLRCSSEHLRLRWSDVNWSEGKITVHSPKTERHPQGVTRTIPIFAELRPYLDAVWEQAEPGTESVIARYRDRGCNLGPQLTRIVRRAGLEPWPKIWQNLRATRQVELEDIYPGHVVCRWIGNSRRVADEHYLRPTEEHYRHAVEGTAQKAAQNPAQQRAAPSGNGSQTPPPHNEEASVVSGENADTRESAMTCDPPKWAVLDLNQ